MNRICRIDTIIEVEQVFSSHRLFHTVSLCVLFIFLFLFFSCLLLDSNTNRVGMWHTYFKIKYCIFVNATITRPLAEVSFKRIWRREANLIIRLGNPGYIFICFKAEAIRTTVPISILIRTTVVPIRILIRTTGM